jgi:hypothetical protein
MSGLNAILGSAPDQTEICATLGGRGDDRLIRTIGPGTRRDPRAQGPRSKAGIVEDTWGARDVPVLSAAVTLLEQSYMVTVSDIAERTGLELNTVARALDALDPTYVDFRKTETGGDPRFWYVHKVTPAARREVGQWPTPAGLIDRLTAAFSAAADREADPSQQDRLRMAARLLGDAARPAAIEVAAAVIGEAGQADSPPQQAPPPYPPPPPSGAQPQYPAPPPAPPGTQPQYPGPSPAPPGTQPQYPAPPAPTSPSTGTHPRYPAPPAPSSPPTGPQPQYPAPPAPSSPPTGPQPRYPAPPAPSSPPTGPQPPYPAPATYPDVLAQDAPLPSDQPLPGQPLPDQPLPVRPLPVRPLPADAPDPQPTDQGHPPERDKSSHGHRRSQRS